MDTYGEELSKTVNMTLDDKKFRDVCTYIYWVVENKMRNLLKFEVTDHIVNVCNANGDDKLYGVSYGVPELWQLSSFEFLNVLNELVQSVFYKKPLEDQSTFLKYFS